MLFNSYVFLMCFLPITWLVYFGCNRLGRYQLAQAMLVAASFLFYGYHNWRLCFLLAGSILINYLFHVLFMEGNMAVWLRRLLLLLGLTVNFYLLFYFKYLDFAIINVNALTGSSFALHHVVLPLGISFYTFQQVSFVIDSYHKKMERYPFLDYALFVAFFPQLVAGPIVLHQEMIPQFEDRTKKNVNYGNLVSGLEYLILGLAKKVLLADVFGRISDASFSTFRNVNSISSAAIMLAYTFEIYFDFSGYCDMAIGLGKLFNFEIPVNFFSPYKAKNISEFWKRWHITLTRFLTTYLYIPLGGNRKGKWRTYVNVLIVFTLSGLWHGANWTFVVWGILHGIAMVFYRMNRERIEKLPGWLMWLLTFAFVNVAWLFFRSDNLREPLVIVYRVLTGGVGGFAPELTSVIYEKSILAALLERLAGEGIRAWLSQLMTGLMFGSGVVICLFAPCSHEIAGRKCRKRWYLWGLALLFLCSVIRLSEVSKFIYFNF